GGNHAARAADAARAAHATDAARAADTADAAGPAITARGPGPAGAAVAACADSTRSAVRLVRTAAARQRQQGGDGANPDRTHRKSPRSMDAAAGRQPEWPWFQTPS